MRFYLDLKTTIAGDATEAVRTARAAVVSRIARSRDWVRVLDDDLEVVVNEMVGQLPREDAVVFLTTVTHGFRSRVLTSGLTISFVAVPLEGAEHAIHVRVRAYTAQQRQAELPTIGLELAEMMLSTLPEFNLAGMVIWQDRGRVEVLAGGVREGRTWREVLRVNEAPSLLAAIAFALLLVLLGAAVLESTEVLTVSVLQGTGLEWFGRLVGPVSATLIASLAAIWVDYRITRERRPYWRIGQAP